MRGAALAAALLAALLLPGRPLGAGVVLVTVLVALAAATAAPVRRESAFFGILALALASLAAVRDAGWIVALDLGGAWLAGSLAVSGPTVRAILAPLVRVRDLPDLSPAVPAGSGPALRGAVLGGLLVTPFSVLFLTADAAFAELVAGLPLHSPPSLPGRAVTFAVVLCAAAGLALAARRPLRGPALRTARRLGPWEWGVPLALLNVLFLVFVAVQLAVLFGGHDYVLQTAGLTYAEYAREGFWQLLAAGTLTLAVVGAAAVLADMPRRGHRLLLRVLLALLGALTLVVLLSALRRLHLYEEAFGLTRPRLLAEAFTLWLGGVFLLVGAAGLFRWVRRRLAGTAAAATGLALLAFSFANPDGLVAERNVERWRETGRVDMHYLRGLSADAAPALAELPPVLRASALAPLAARLAEDDPWSSYNVARERARALVAGSR